MHKNLQFKFQGTYEIKGHPITNIKNSRLYIPYFVSFNEIFLSTVKVFSKMNGTIFTLFTITESLQLKEIEDK